LALQDYRLNAQVRQLLVRKCISLTDLEHGVTNSVVYLKGTVRCYMEREPDSLSQARQDEAQLAAKLEKFLRSLPGVRDVVFQLERVVKAGSKWKPR